VDYTSLLRKRVPSPRKERKPTVSVHIVRRLTDPSAGSNRSNFRNKGMIVPRRAATKRLAMMANPKINPKYGFFISK
jgi:hypothetical protein